MTSRRRLFESRNAAREIDAIVDWWKEERPAAPSLFIEELSSAYDLLRSHPEIGQKVLGAKSDRVRRLLLRRSHYHVYYQISRDAESIEVLAVWSSVKGQQPKL